MAKILHSEAAPSEVVHYSLAGVDFDLGGSNKAFQTTDAAVISNAVAHPWLKVERDKAEVLRGSYVEPLKPEDDALSAVNSVALDPKAVKAAQEQPDETVTPVAIDAGENQKESVKTGPVAETLAADPSSKTSDKKDNS